MRHGETDNEADHAANISGRSDEPLGASSEVILYS